MPLIKPEVQKVLREAGLVEKTSSEEGSLTRKLEDAGLGLSQVLDELATIALRSGNESLRAKTLETVLKAHGALKESVAPPPSFTIVIQSSPQVDSAGIPGIEKLPAGVNPILLPRQLLNKLTTEPKSD